MVPSWTRPGRALHGPRPPRREERRQGAEQLRVGAGRMREEVPGLYGDPERARRVEALVSAVDGVLEVRASARTGRALVRLRDRGPDAQARVLQALALAADPAAPPPPSLRRVLRKARGAVRGGVSKVRERARPPSSERGGAAETAQREPFHALAADEVARRLDVDPNEGLTSAEASRRRAVYGDNALPGIAKRSRADILASQVFTVPSGLLGGAVGLSAALGDLLEAGAIAIVIGSNIAVGYVVESRAEELLAAWESLHAESARVVRDGREEAIRADDLVPGDVLVLRRGDAIAADARVVASDGLATDESTLTGESEPAEKSTAAVDEDEPLADRDGMVYAGTRVAAGEGRAVVVATGAHTELGAIQAALSHAQTRAAPLERQLDDLGRRIAILSVASSGVVVALSLLRGRSLRETAKSAVALAVAAIPEGLPAAGTTALALASRRLYRSGIVIRRLAAAETLGAVSVVCADKTGTLTENRMRVAEIFLRDEGLVKVELARDGDGRPSAELRRCDGSAPDPAHVRDLARIAALNADVEVGAKGVKSGSGTERALVELAIATGYPVVRSRKSARRLREVRRAPDRPYMVTVHDHPELGVIELVKGAPEHVLERCQLDDAERARLLEQNRDMASRGLRVLALAWRRDGKPDNTAPLTLAGLVGLRDPARPGVRDALARLAGAGIRTIMLTGDQEATAVAIGQQLGIAEADVHARVTPAAKVDVVRELQDEGAIVAMTGDGVNDGPALEAADVGIAMGERGTDVARAVADVVLAHDDLASIASAVEEGRRLYDNIRRAIDYLIATNLSEVLVTVLGSALATQPLRPLQLLWLNILTDVAPALALALEPADAGVMQRPPRDPSRPIFVRDDYERLGKQGGRMAGASLAAYALGALRGGGTRASSMAFVSLVTSQILHTRACRAHTSQHNPELDLAVGGAAFAQVLAIGTRSLRKALLGGAMSPLDLVLALAAGAAPTLWRERASLFAEPRDAIVVTHAEARARAPEREPRPADERLQPEPGASR